MEETGIQLTRRQVMSCSYELQLLNERIDKETKEVYSKSTMMPSKLGYWIGRLEDKISSLEKKGTKIRETLVKNFGEKALDENGKEIPNSYKVPPAKHEAYSEELEKFLEEIVVVDFKKLSFELFLLDEKGSDGNKKQIELPKSFWASVGIHFVNEPE